LKPEKKKRNKVILTVVVCFLVIYLALSVYGSREAMRIPRLPLTYAPGSLMVAYDDVSFQSRDGLTLKGWFLPGQNEQVIIVIHGGFQNRIDDNVDTLALARALVGKGYSVLLFDLRGRGESEGRGISLSYIDEDIGGAVDFVKSRGFGVADTCILGFCSGAAMVSTYGSRNQVGALILDGCFLDCGTMVRRQAQSINIPGFFVPFFMPGGLVFTRLLYGYHRIDPIDIIPLVKSPVLFLHEEKDEFTTMPETRKLYEAANNPANEIMEFSGSLHSHGFRDHPQEYIDRVDNFLKKLRRP